MKCSLFIIGILCVAASCSDNGDQVHQHLPLKKKYAPKVLKEDYEQLIRVIKKNHPALYAYTPREELDELMKLQFEKITDSLSISDFYNLVVPIVSKIGCGHTNLNLPDWVWKDFTVAILPFNLFFHDRRAYITKDYTDQETLGVGTEILSIDGQNIHSLLEEMEGNISTDGDNASAKREMINQNFFQLLARQEDFPPEYKISFRRSQKDSILDAHISAMPSQAYFDLQPKPDSLLQFEIDSPRSTAVLTIRSFGFYERVKEFEAFIDDSFEKMRKAKVDHLILDLRNNGGGDPFCASYLMTYLCKEPVVYFSEPYPPYETLAKPMQLAKNHFSGKLYTLIDGGCFSTTGHLCALLRYHHIGEFIGTETGGTYTCNDNSQTYRLINTGILARVARGTFSVAVHGIPRFSGIKPDYEVQQSLQDALMNTDTVKSFVLSRIGQSVISKTNN